MRDIVFRIMLVSAVICMAIDMRLSLLCLDRVHASRGQSDDGMVIDFGDIKQLALKHLVEPWDHAFLVAKQDTVLVKFLESLPSHKTVILEDVPTVENLVKFAFDILAPIFAAETKGQLVLKTVRLYETPNCWADYHAQGA
jgi:6-pyruvoyltetrahydropterin/6-carboxytetrahydropterin synthase